MEIHSKLLGTSLDFTKESIDTINEVFGIDIRKEESTDLYMPVLLMSKAYEKLSTGIHNNVQAADRGEEPPIAKNVEPVAWASGGEVRYKTEFLYSCGSLSKEKQPTFITGYNTMRDHAYSTLFTHALETNNYEPLLQTIYTYKESTLAQRLLKELHAKKQRYPDMYAGNVQRIRGRITAHNNHIQKIRDSSEQFALDYANKIRNNELRKTLNDDSTGILGAISVGIRAKFPLRDAQKWKEVVLYQPLRETAALPPVAEQLIHTEKNGLSINKDN